MTDLKPCPFCGGDVRITRNDRGCVFVRCSLCNMTLMFGANDVCKSEQAVVRMWNRRAGEQYG